jgi:beta-lactamase regulating signal transducer with metallopeptidase domain
MPLFEWLVRAAVLATLVGIGAWALEEVLRGANRSARFVWIGALLLSIALPASSLFLPDLWPELLKRPASVVDWSNANAFTAQLESVLQEKITRDVVAITPRWSARELALAVWIVASVLLGLRWVHGWYRLRRARVRWKEAILAGERVLVSENLGPAVVGLVRPRVVVPSWLFLGSTNQQRMIVRHELQHLRAGDQWLLAFAPVLVALFPWNPALWWQLRRLRIAIELDCDARVLRGGESALEYGCMLLDVAGSTTVLQPTLAALSEPRTSLERRIRAMTPTRYQYALTRAASLTLLCTIALAGAIVAIAPTAQRVSAQQAVPVPAQAAPVRVQQQEGSPLVVMDGKVMVGAKVNFGDLSLASVEVLKPAEAVRKFGARARYGAVVITTSGSELVAKAADQELEPVIVRGELKALPLKRELATKEASRAHAIEIKERSAKAAEIAKAVEKAHAAEVKEHLVKAEQVAEAIAKKEAAELKERSVNAEMREAIAKKQASAVMERSIREALAAEAIEKAPAKAADPIVYVDGVKLPPKAASAPARATTSQNAVNPILVIDGVVVGRGADALKVLTATLSPEQIERIEIVKGAAARQLYGDYADDGVIYITTKKRQ